MCTSTVTIGLVLALYGLATHYVAAMRRYAPLPVEGLFDAKAQIGNVFYSAATNTAEFLPNLVSGQFSAAVGNLTNMAGIRADIYTRVLHANATNNAETFVRLAPTLLLGLLLFRLLHYLHRHRERGHRWLVQLAAWLKLKRRARRQSVSAARIQMHRDALDRESRFFQFSFDQSLVFVAQVGLSSAIFTALMLNTVEYYQGITGLTGVLGYFGSGIVTVLDHVTATGAWMMQEIVWHLFFAVTDGKEKTLGLLTGSGPLENVSHYLGRFPAERVSAALHTAIFQALCAGACWAIAHYFQDRLAKKFVAKYDALPPHMKRYLARRRR